MEKLLFEIGTEEIPANFMSGILAQLKELTEKNIELAIEFDTDAIQNHYSFDMFYTDAEAFATLAEIQNKLGKRDSAKENILKAVSLEPNNKKLLDLKTKLGY